MTSYSEFAKFYDTAMGDMTAKVDFLQNLIEKNAPKATTLLELACGTGTILKGLSEKYHVSGLDMSSEMAEIAKKKLPGVDIRTGDMISFDFGKTFDIVLCVYDSINHLFDWEGWRATIANAHRHLNDGGIFVFDFNTIERLQWLADNPPYERELSGNYMIMDVKKEGERFNWDIKVFEKAADGRFALRQDTIYEISFPVEQVRTEVEKNFTIKNIVDSKNLDTSNPDWRPFFVCSK